MRARLALAAAALALIVTAQAHAQGLQAQSSVEIAMAMPDRADIELCLGPSAAPALVATTCTDALDSGRLDTVDRARALSKRAAARHQMGDEHGARADLLQAANQYSTLISPASPEVTLLYARATIWHALGEADQALADYNLAARLDPKDPIIFLNRGILLERFKADYALALVDFEQVLSLKPKDPDVLTRAQTERATLITFTASASP